ncbi:protein phosphatase 2C domain-containing protein [Gloeocapsopsis crepidinum LEGE 06123]|uniref:Protein phosphatase 2C domain-containing protein n=2 Tax=Gloeocapsopsis crepidinum TaxID=693223 RepID=A0ABR9UQ08_9CHRO|nr:PP2C family serine/threonine-protein phosphatase [Gloeocapsopsis crepidinum]MBE9190359.1 protein phosphatase 2C domain-containing protein [Gloeocapsopsis crepidinum LEGE 06123]
MNVNDFFRQKNTVEEVSWRVAAASVRGRGHEKVGQLCQDAHFWEKLPEGILVAAVADGAGSANLGKVGAIVAAQTAVKTVRDRLAIPPLPNDDSEWRVLLNEALTVARTTVEAEAVACQLSARELATTLILVVATPSLVVAAQVGDGVAVASDQQGNLISLTTPQFGEYINETTFLVSPQALDTAQITLWQGKTAKIALLSDGLQMLALELDQGKPYAPFFSPLFHFVAQIQDETEAKDQLVSFLRSPRIAERTDDDLTLLLATLS